MNNVDLKPVLNFLGGLKGHNNKAWFDAHRADYETAKERFESFVDGLIRDLGAIEDLRGVSAKDCVMRIYRDVRFSKDKTPYKTNMGASIGPGGKKSTRLGYYLHLAPDGGTMVAGGLHMPEPAQLAKFRKAIDKNARPFKSIVNDKTYQSYFGPLGGEKLKTAPQGFDRDHPEIELLRLKEIVAVHRIPDKDVLSPGFGNHVIKAFTAMKPFLDYLNG
jgi:uncharacterized protein (TIGR02453 family)